jgi:DNA-binding CsgD family transcriptional regulator
MLDMIPEVQRAEFLEEAQRRARQFLHAVSRLAGAGSQAACPQPLWVQDTFHVAATTIEMPGRTNKSCLIRLSIPGGISLDQLVAAGLTTRECGVAMLVMEGMSNKAIAYRLSISEHTARRHTESILRKLRVTNRSSVASAVRGLLGPLNDSKHR